MKVIKFSELGISGLAPHGQQALQIINQITPFDAESLGDPQKRMKANPLFSPFYLANINRMQIRFFRQLFLTQFSRFAVFANRFAKNFEGLLTRHSLLGKHCRVKLKTPNMGLFTPCASAGSLHELTPYLESEL
jgi:hypothetical protein